jgi:hypothetical protein
MRRPRMVSGARALRRGAVRHAIGTLLTLRERGCCERGTLRGPFVLRAHALVLAGEPLPHLRAVRICESYTGAVVAILMEPPELDLKSPSDHMPQCRSQSNESRMLTA